MLTTGDLSPGAASHGDRAPPAPPFAAPAGTLGPKLSDSLVNKRAGLTGGLRERSATLTPARRLAMQSHDGRMKRSLIQSAWPSSPAATAVVPRSGYGSEWL